MSFRSRTIQLSLALVALLICLPGCQTCREGRAQISKWLSHTPRRTSRRAVVRPTYPQQTYPKASNPNGPWPNPHFCPETEERPLPEPDSTLRGPVVPAPDAPDTPDASDIPPAPEPSTEDADPMSVPLPSPPRLPTRAKTSQPRALPPVPDMDDVSEVVPERRQSQRLPELRTPAPTPSSLPEPEFSPVPSSSLSPVPRLAERPFPGRQPVQLQTPEAESNLDPFDEDPQPTQGRSPVRAFPEPADDEDLELPPETIPPTLSPPIETQSWKLERGRSRERHAIEEQNEESLELPPHSASVSPRKGQGLRILNLQVARNTRVGPESAIDPQTLHAGQDLVVQGDFSGVKYLPRNDQYESQLSYQIQLRTMSQTIVVSTNRQEITEAASAPLSAQRFSQWLTIPSKLQPGAYRLTLLVRDENSRATNVADLPVRVY